MTYTNTTPTPTDRLVIGRGTLSDFETLKHWHYRAGRPATSALVLRAVDPQDPFARSCASRIVGVLVVSYPTLNGGWRKLAWPGRYDTLTRKDAASRINRELRCISRVVIDPRWRGVGLARMLVRSYLDGPLTPMTEAIAVMGIASPFFRSAGMTEYTVAPSRASARLLDVCDHCDIAPDRISASLAMPQSPALLVHELRRWGRSSPSTRNVTDPVSLARAAESTICAAPMAYAHTFEHMSKRTLENAGA